MEDWEPDEKDNSIKRVHVYTYPGPSCFEDVHMSMYRTQINCSKKRKQFVLSPQSKNEVTTIHLV